ncbi:MAG: DedA family protein, partial [Nanoarchaeota archaeon]
NEKKRFKPMIISDILSVLGVLATKLISVLGYAGIFFLMMLESMVAPIPSELVMPFAGFLIAQGRFSWWGVLLASSLGSIVGSLLSYYAGQYGGKALVIRYGKYLLLDECDLKKTEEWFARKGEKAVFICRFIPVIRHLISIPAGIGKMELKKFVLYTLIGATIWNMFLAYVGFKLGENWAELRHYSEYISIPVAVILVLCGVYFVYHHWKHKRKM